MSIEELVGGKRDEIRRIAEKHGARHVRVFGSMARGDADAGSDVDFLVEAGPRTSSWFPAGLILDLEELLGRRVEVITDAGLNPFIRDQVLKEAVPM